MQLTLYRCNEEKANKDVEKINDAISRYCTENNIECIDLNHYLSDETGLKKEFSLDGTHLNDKGYEVWSVVLRDFLKRKL